jgi:hypothetical protein
MISVNSRAFDEDDWIAFPGLSVSLFGINKPNRSSVGFLGNPIEFRADRVGIDNYFAVVKDGFNEENLLRNRGLRHNLLSFFCLRRYSFLPYRTQRELSKRLPYLGVGVQVRFVRSRVLGDLSWVSAKYRWRWSSPAVIDFMESPVLIFDSSRLSDLADIWCSAFASFLRLGFLRAESLYKVFYLGSSKFEFS